MNAIRRRPQPNYNTEPTATVKMAHAICEQVYSETRNKDGSAAKAACACKGRSVACTTMEQAALAATQAMIDHYKENKQ